MPGMIRPLIARHLRLGLTVLAALVSPLAHADWFTGTINRIQIGADNHLVVYVDAPTNHQCGSNRLDYSDSNAAGFKNVYAALLAWEAQEKRVQFSITGCNGAAGIFSYVEDLK